MVSCIMYDIAVLGTIRSLRYQSGKNLICRIMINETLVFLLMKASNHVNKQGLYKLNYVFIYVSILKVMKLEDVY